MLAAKVREIGLHVHGMITTSQEFEKLVAEASERVKSLETKSEQVRVLDKMISEKSREVTELDRRLTELNRGMDELRERLHTMRPLTT